MADKLINNKGVCRTALATPGLLIKKRRTHLVIDLITTQFVELPLGGPVGLLNTEYTPTRHVVQLLADPPCARSATRLNKTTCMVVTFEPIMQF